MMLHSKSINDQEFLNQSKRVAVKNIFAATTELEIFNKYIPNFKVETSIVSPLRSEKTPSFTVFNSSSGNSKLMFKDHKTSLSGNCIKFVQLLLQKEGKDSSLEATLTKIAEDFNIPIPFLGVNGKIEENTTHFISHKVNIKIPKTFIPELVNWNTSNHYYWKDKYNLGTEILDFYCCRPTKAVFYESLPDLKGNVRVSRLWSWKNSDPIYTYVDLINNEMVYRCYRPLHAIKRRKWLGTMGAGFYGLRQLKKKPTIIVAKSYKDCIMFASFGACVVAVGGEAYNIGAKELSFLNTFANVVFFYDNDERGLMNLEIQKTLNPQFHYCHYPVDWLDNYNIKDTADCVEIMKFDKAKESTRKIINETLKVKV